MPGELEEDVVERGPAHADVQDVHVALVEGPHGVEERCRPAGDGRHKAAGVLIHVDGAGGQPDQDLAGISHLAGPDRHGESLATHLCLELIRGSACDDLPPVDDGDRVRELVRLVQVLRGQQHGRPLCHEALNDLPEPQATARVQTRRRLVEEDDRGSSDQGPCEVQTPAHATGVGLGGPVRRIDEVELLEQLLGPHAGRLAGQVVEPSDHDQVLPPGQVLVNGRVLAGQPDRSAHTLRVGCDVDPVHDGPAGVGCEQRGQDAHRGGLPGAVGPEQPEHAARGDVEVHPVKSPHLT